MKKIGIATPYKVANYGTKLQAYAIATYIKSISDEEVEIINYTPSSDRRIGTIIRKSISIKRNIARINKILAKKNVANIINPKLLEARRNAINSFDIRLPLGQSINGYSELKKYSKQFDCIICGSDQIWLPDNIMDQYYTLDFCDANVRKGSYAASLGVESINKKQQLSYIRFLKKLDFISLREDSGKKIINAFLPEKKIEWVCDPTFLLPKEHWRQVETRPEILDSISSKYVFCYFLGTDAEQRKIVSEYAKKNNLLVLSVANFKGYCEEDTLLTDIQLYDLTVNQFLYLIDNAQMVCTDSMHATVFSIIFENNFVTFERFKRDDKNSRNSRIYSLLKAVGLENRLISDTNMPVDDIKYDEINLQKEDYIRKSQKFIREEIV